MMNQHHHDGIEKPLAGAEIAEAEFFDFKKPCAGSHPDDVFTQKPDSEACKRIDSACAFENVNAPSQKEAQYQEHIPVSLRRIKQNENDINIRNGDLVKYHFIEDENLQ